MIKGVLIMFLNRLNETTKESFLKLCVHASLSNGVFAKEERETLFAYCREMNVKENVPDTPETFEELIKKINEETSTEEKNIYILEILALIKCDGIYDEKEQEFMKKLAYGLGFSDAILAKYNNLLDKYLKIEKELYTAIIE